MHFLSITFAKVTIKNQSGRKFKTKNHKDIKKEEKQRIRNIGRKYKKRQDQQFIAVLALYT